MTPSVVPYCDRPPQAHAFNGFGNNNRISDVYFLPGGASYKTCCETCVNSLDCVLFFIQPGVGENGEDFCFILTKNVPLDGAPTSEQCPLGIEKYQLADPNVPDPTDTYIGPCRSGL